MTDLNEKQIWQHQSSRTWSDKPLTLLVAIILMLIPVLTWSGLISTTTNSKFGVFAVTAVLFVGGVYIFVGLRQKVFVVVDRDIGMIKQIYTWGPITTTNEWQLEHFTEILFFTNQNISLYLHDGGKKTLILFGESLIETERLGINLSTYIGIPLRKVRQSSEGGDPDII